MIALDTDIIVHWLMSGARHHRAILAFLQSHLARSGAQIAIVPQVLHEFIHVVTDPKRFESPLPMATTIDLARSLWESHEVRQVQATSRSVARTFELLTEYKLGRKRILDTALAATLESAGVRQLATLNGREYGIFAFLEVIDPT